MTNPRSLGGLVACAFAVVLLAGCVQRDNAASEPVFTQVGIARLPSGEVDLAAYSKLAPWPQVKGDYLYSGCYTKAPLLPYDPNAGRCFMVIDVTRPEQPVRVATYHTYDIEASPPPGPDHAVWSDDYPYPNLPARSPCQVDWDDSDIRSGRVRPACWDPGWNTQSHYVAVIPGRLLAVNQERWRYGTQRQANWHGVRFYSLENPAEPAEISYWEAPEGVLDPATGVVSASGGTHHFNFAGDFLLLGTEYAGYIGRILVVLDVSEPRSPVEVSRWSLPGQKTPEDDAVRDWEQQRFFSRPISPIDGEDKWSAYVGMHYVTVADGIAYLAYHQAGLVILDVRDMTEPELLSWTNYLRPGADPATPNVRACQAAAGNRDAACGNTHSAKVIPGTDLLVVEDEYFTCPFGHVRLFDISEPRSPEIVSQYWLPATLDCSETEPRKARDDSAYPIRGPSSHIGNAWSQDIYFTAWYGAGLQAIDVSEPTDPVSAGEFRYRIVEGADGEARGLNGSDTYDVVLGRNGHIFVADGTSGLRVLRYESRDDQN